MSLDFKEGGGWTGNLTYSMYAASNCPSNATAIVAEGATTSLVAMGGIGGTDGETGSFLCETDVVAGTETAYTKFTTECAANGILMQMYNCALDMCGNCSTVPEATIFSEWSSFSPPFSSCWEFTMLEKTNISSNMAQAWDQASEKISGATSPVSQLWTGTADPTSYMEYWIDNSCIKDGPPQEAADETQDAVAGWTGNLTYSIYGAGNCPSNETAIVEATTTSLVAVGGSGDDGDETDSFLCETDIFAEAPTAYTKFAVQCAADGILMQAYNCAIERCGNCSTVTEATLFYEWSAFSPPFSPCWEFVALEKTNISLNMAQAWDQATKNISGNSSPLSQLWTGTADPTSYMEYFISNTCIKDGPPKVAETENTTNGEKEETTSAFLPLFQKTAHHYNLIVAAVAVLLLDHFLY